MKSFRLLSAACAALFLAVATALAGNPTGSWHWTVQTPNGDIETTLKLELKDGQLSGTYSNQFGETAISAASFKDDAISFKVERDMGGTSFTLSYSGKLEGDAITGKIVAPSFDGGEPRTLDWKATRAAKP